MFHNLFFSAVEKDTDFVRGDQYFHLVPIVCYIIFTVE